MGPSLLVNCYLEIKFHKKSGWTPHSLIDMFLILNRVKKYDYKKL